MRFTFFSILVLTQLILQSQSALISVAVIYRHGDRTPNHFYVNDPYQNLSYWPEGLGQLTNVGKMRQYHLGKWLRNRYSSLLPDFYSPEDLWVETDNMDRTIMSALANLAGLYPPRKTQLWNNDLQWMPVPIHNRPDEEDAVIAMKKSCPKYDKLYKQALKSDYFQKLYRDNKKVFDYLTKNTGQTIKSFKDATTIYTTLKIEQANNLTLPVWTGVVYPEKLRKLAEYHMYSYVYSKPLLRLKSGPLLSYLMENFEDIVISGTKRKFLMVSAHDKNVVGLLEAFGGLKDYYPDFASTVILELHQDDSQFYIKIFYKTEDQMSKIQLKGCTGECSYEDFKTILQNVTVEQKEWQKNCFT